MNFQEYSKLALSTASPNTFKDMPDKVYNLTHAVLGMSDESFEIASSKTKGEFVEELGDFAWFHALACSALDHKPDEAISKEDLKKKAPAKFADPTDMVNYLSGLVKSAFAYGKELQEENIKITLDTIHLTIVSTSEEFLDTSIEDIRYSNIEKLQGKQGRYRSGEYTAEEEKDRKRKLNTFIAAFAALDKDNYQKAKAISVEQFESGKYESVSVGGLDGFVQY